MVPPKGAEAKPKMFFLFSDMLLQVKRCSSLHSTSGQKFTAEHAYPLQDCTVEKVFGHTRSQGGLLSVSVCQSLKNQQRGLSLNGCMNGIFLQLEL